MTASAQERQQGFLAKHNTVHEALAKEFGYRLTIVPAVQTVQTQQGTRLEIEMRFGLQEVAGWAQPDAGWQPTNPGPVLSPNGETP